MPGAVSFPYCPERKLNTVSLLAEYGLYMLLFSSDLKPVIIELNSDTDGGNKKVDKLIFLYYNSLRNIFVISVIKTKIITYILI